LNSDCLSVPGKLIDGQVSDVDEGGLETDDRIIERLPLGLGTFEQDTITSNGGGRGRFF
jgi:hypothetical protein